MWIKVILNKIIEAYVVSKDLFSFYMSNLYLGYFHFHKLLYL
jgi:hypothetical protein